jgi:hypothetical protein
MCEHVRSVHYFGRFPVSLYFILWEPLLHAFAYEVLRLCWKSIKYTLDQSHWRFLVKGGVTPLYCMKNATVVCDIRYRRDSFFWDNVKTASRCNEKHDSQIKKVKFLQFDKLSGIFLRVRLISHAAWMLKLIFYEIDLLLIVFQILTKPKNPNQWKGRRYSYMRELCWFW